jgi:hypothetical protein
MKKFLLASLALSLVPSFALAATPKTLKGQIAKDVRMDPAAKGLKFRANRITTEALNGPEGRFSFQAAKPNRLGLPATIYDVSGSWMRVGTFVKLSNVKVAPTPFQPFVMQPVK